MNLDLQNRSPKVERLPDARLRVTRLFSVLNNIPKTPAGLVSAGLWLDWGTADVDYTNCRLIRQDITGQEGKFRTPVEEPPFLVQVYEEIPRNDQIIVGNPSISYDQYGNKTAEIDYIQFSTGTSTYNYIVGTTQAPSPNGDCFLKSSKATNDGTLIRTTRTFINKGQLSDTEQLKFNGKLLLRELTYLNEIPPTPAGWTLVTQSIEFIEGLPVYRYGFVNGGGGGGGAGGEISRKTDYKISPDQGTTGVTVTTIQYITDPSVDTNPITGPTGSELISFSYDDQDGYRLWTAVYASGQGTISSDVEVKNGGKLILYSITSINTAPASPSPSIGGTVVLIKTNVRNGTDAADGTVIYDFQWAEGNGVVESDFEYKNNGLLVLYKIISFGVPPDAPAPTIGGTILQTQANRRKVDGYTIYDYEWAEGKGVITTEIETKNNGALILYRTTSLGDIPTAPSPTIGGSVTQTSQSQRLVDGYVIYDYSWAEGKGEISSKIETKNGGKLIIYTISALGDPPTAPDPTIGGTVTLIDENTIQRDGNILYEYSWAEGVGEIGRETRYEQSTDEGTTGLTVITIRYLSNLATASNPIATPSGFIKIGESSSDQDGYKLWSGTYAKGTGTVSTQVRTREDGSKVTNVTSLSETPDTPSGSGYLVGLDQDLASGHYINRATYIDLPSTTTYIKTVKNWQMPGFAYFSGTQLVLEPPTTRDLLASVEVSYDTSQITTVPFSVIKWASFYFTYTTTETATVPSQTVNGSQGLTGYLSEGGTTFGTNSDYNGVLCDSYSATKVASDPTSLPTGDIVIDVDNDPYLVAIDGTKVFKRTVTTINV